MPGGFDMDNSDSQNENEKTDSKKKKKTKKTQKSKVKQVDVSDFDSLGDNSFKRERTDDEFLNDKKSKKYNVISYGKKVKPSPKDYPATKSRNDEGTRNQGDLFINFDSSNVVQDISDDNS